MAQAAQEPEVKRENMKSPAFADFANDNGLHLPNGGLVILNFCYDIADPATSQSSTRRLRL
jgi:hypothetical protein